MSHRLAKTHCSIQPPRTMSAKPGNHVESLEQSHPETGNGTPPRFRMTGNSFPRFPQNLADTGTWNRRMETERRNGEKDRNPWNTALLQRNELPPERGIVEWQSPNGEFQEQPGQCRKPSDPGRFRCSLANSQISGRESGAVWQTVARCQVSEIQVQPECHVLVGLRQILRISGRVVESK